MDTKDIESFKEKRDNKKRAWEQGILYQVENYYTLGITKSYRGQVVITLAAVTIILTSISFFAGLFQFDAFIISASIYLALSFFILRGSRVAMVVLFLVWTFNGFYAVFIMGEGFFIPFIIWSLVAYPLNRAFIVENQRAKILPSKT